MATAATDKKECKICGALTSRSMEHHIHERHPSIKIGRHTFQLCTKNLTTQYMLIEILNITSENPDERFPFIVYKSNSHGGIFRLCTTDSPSHLYKGKNDYVTQTFIHIELQKFIIENHFKLIEKKELSAGKCPNLKSRINPKGEDKTPYEELIDGEGDYRKYNDNTGMIERLNVIECGFGFENIKRLLSTLESGYAIPRSRFTGKLTYFQEIIDLIKSENKGCENIKMRASHQPLTTALDRCDGKISIRIRKTILRKYLEYISNYLNEIFDIIPRSNKLLYVDTFTIPKIESVTIEMNYYSIDIQLKESKEGQNNRFTVICGVYNIKSERYRRLNGNYNIVFNMIPAENNVDGKLIQNTISRIGLYTFYTTMGVYLCKIFDYVSQVEIIKEEDNIFGDYAFMGDIYHNLFPANRL